MQNNFLWLCRDILYLPLQTGTNIKLLVKLLGTLKFCVRSPSAPVFVKCFCNCFCAKFKSGLVFQARNYCQHYTQTFNIVRAVVFSVAVSVLFHRPPGESTQQNPHPFIYLKPKKAERGLYVQVTIGSTSHGLSPFPRVEMSGAPSPNDVILIKLKRHWTISHCHRTKTDATIVSATPTNTRFHLTS